MIELGLLTILAAQIPTGYGIQAWVVSVVIAGLGVLKGLQYLQIIWARRDANGNGVRIYESIHEAEFRGKIATLIQNQLELLRAIEEGRNNDRAIWGPALSELMSAQNSLAKMLDEHAQMLAKHDEREGKVWEHLINMIDRFQTNANEAWEICHEKLVNIEGILVPGK